MWKISLRVFQKVVSVDGVTFLREHDSLTGIFSLAETKRLHQRKLEQDERRELGSTTEAPVRVVESTRPGALIHGRNIDEAIIGSNRTVSYDTSLG